MAPWSTRGQTEKQFRYLSTTFIPRIFFSSVSQSCLILCDFMDCSKPGFPVHHQLPELTQTHVHWVSDAIQPPHPLSSPSPPALNLSQHQGLFKWVTSLHQVSKLLAFQLQHALPKNIQDWFPLRWTGWISLKSKGLSRVFSNDLALNHHVAKVLELQLQHQSFQRIFRTDFL